MYNKEIETCIIFRFTHIFLKMEKNTVVYTITLIRSYSINYNLAAKIVKVSESTN